MVCDLLDPGREEHRHLLLGESGRGVEALDLGPVTGAPPDLLDQLALGAIELRLALDVELARRQLEQTRLSDRLARLADEPDDLVVVGGDRHRARVRRDLAIGLLAIVVAEAVDPDVDDRALVNRLRIDSLHPVLLPVDRRGQRPSRRKRRRKEERVVGDRAPHRRRRQAARRVAVEVDLSTARSWRPVQIAIRSSSAACADPPSGAPSRRAAATPRSRPRARARARAPAASPRPSPCGG